MIIKLLQLAALATLRGYGCTHRLFLSELICAIFATRRLLTHLLGKQLRELIRDVKV